MLLSSNTLVNLYVCAAVRHLSVGRYIETSTDGGQYGSLLWRKLSTSSHCIIIDTHSARSVSSRWMIGR